MYLLKKIHYIYGHKEIVMNDLSYITPEIAYEQLRHTPRSPLAVKNWTDPQVAFPKTPVTEGNFIALCTAGHLVFEADNEKQELFSGDVVVVSAGKRLLLLAAEEFKGQFLHMDAPAKPLLSPLDLGRYDSVFLRFIELAEKHLYSPIRFYASQLDCPLQELNWYCRRNSGMTAQQWLTRYVLLEARHLLREGMKVGETARRLHFSQASHFSAWFTRLTKKSPYTWGHGYTYR